MKKKTPIASSQKKQKQTAPAHKKVDAPQHTPTAKTNADFAQIESFVKLIHDYNIAELSFEKQGYKLTLKQKGNPEPMPISMPQTFISAPQPSAPSTPAAAPTPTPQPKAPAPKATNQITIKSPMIGTFYRKPSPKDANYVDVGTEIKPGQTLCIVEAMKILNHIDSEVSGKIVDILVEDSSPVEFDQPLFIVEP